eukprot:CAMPEP_0179190570 /NCGR_PEP_ID=MMETSP0796-20121207/94626_1 /TAXON_ID=73915 /ORGANISM="Pyrodinium bahamense, Strain pbaha01" /LENGTH=63 /DNA_ID=CAMNT_0020894741 /DNA_START=6 /DNA_END=195 /DNA_ORIENTATION=-
MKLQDLTDLSEFRTPLKWAQGNKGTWAAAHGQAIDMSRHSCARLDYMSLHASDAARVGTSSMP